MNAKHRYKMTAPNGRRVSESIQNDFVYWHAPHGGPAPAPLKSDVILVEQLPSPVGQMLGRHSMMRPKMGVSARAGGVNMSTPNPPSPVPHHEGDEEEPIYCEITKGDSPIKTPPSLKQHQPVQRRNHPTAKRANHSKKDQTSSSSSGTSGSKHRNQEKRLARDFSEIRLNPTAFSDDHGKMNESRRISCDFGPHFGGGPAQPPPPIFHAPRPLGLGRRAVTQVDIPLSTRHHNHPQPQFQPHVFHPAPPPMFAIRKHQQIRNATVLKPSRQMSATGSSCSGGVVSDSEYSRRPMPSVAPSRRPKLQQKALHGDYSSEYGFHSGLDETTSTTTATESLAETGSTNLPVPNGTAIRKGLLWQQRDKIFSRWKERFFILTPDYLQCFKKGTSKITEMGGFIFKLKLAEIEDVELVDKKGYLTISLSLNKEGKVFLRKPEGIREWFQALKTCVESCREKRGMMKTTKEFWSKKQFTDSSSMEQYILARKRIEMKYAYSETESCASTANGQSRLYGQSSRDLSRSNLNMARRTPLTTTDYGFIDLPQTHGTDLKSSSTDLQTISPISHVIEDLESRSSISPTSSSSDYVLKKLARDTSSTFSHDSGVDSMNTNSSGSVMSHQTPTYSSSTTSSKYAISSAPNKAAQTPRKSMIPRHKPVKGSRPSRDEILRNVSLV